MARTRITMNKRGMNAALSDSQMGAALMAEAEAAAARARASAPVRSGEYRDSIETGLTTTEALGIRFKSGGSRAAAVVKTTAPHGLLVEMKTGNLKRALGG